MIAPRDSSSHSIKLDPERAQASILTFYNRRQPATTPRWVCEVCGMIQPGITPLLCDSCGSEHLYQQADLHREMNNHW